MTYADRLLTALRNVDREVVARSRGAHPIAPRWWESLERFYRSGCEQLVVRKGRRVGASTTVMPRLFVATLLVSQHPIPEGETSVLGCVSVKRKEAVSRLRNVEAVLKVMRVPYKMASDEIEVVGTGRVIKVLTASHRTEVGQCIELLWCDELSRWYNEDTSTNPASEVMAALKPSLATVENSKRFLVSSPMGDEDYHAKEYERGDTDDQCVDHFATWDVIPALTKERTKRLEPDEKTWLREYGGVPSATVEENWFGVAPERSVETAPLQPPPHETNYIVTVDPAFAHDQFGWSVSSSIMAGVELTTGKPRRLTQVHAVGQWVPDRSPSEMARRLKREVVDKFCPSHPVVYTDQFEGHSFVEIGRMVGLNVIVVPWTGGSGPTAKITKYRKVRTAMLEGTFKIPANDELIKQFRSVRGVITPMGERIEMPRTAKGHGDMVSAVVMGGEIAMSRSPAQLSVPGARKYTREWYEENARQRREEMAREVRKRNAKRWQKNPHRVMREAMGM